MEILPKEWINFNRSILTKITSHNILRLRWADVEKQSSDMPTNLLWRSCASWGENKKWDKNKFLLKCVIQRHKYKNSPYNAKEVWFPLSVWEHKMLSRVFEKHKPIQNVKERERVIWKLHCALNLLLQINKFNFYFHGNTVFIATRK